MRQRLIRYLVGWKQTLHSLFLNKAHYDIVNLSKTLNWMIEQFEKLSL